MAGVLQVRRRGSDSWEDRSDLLREAAQDALHYRPRLFPIRESHPAWGYATLDDVYFAYRLYLRRAPDPAGWSDWLKQFAQEALTLDQVKHRFLHSREFLTRWGREEAPLPGAPHALPRYRVLWRGLRRRLGLRIGEATAVPDRERATADDVYYCYRLFLNRAPDAQGWRFWQGRLADRPVALAEVKRAFLEAEEFRALQERDRARLAQPQPLRLDGYTIFFRPDDRAVGATIAEEKVYEPAVTRELAARLRPGSVFLDLGANIGYYTFLAATRVGPAGRVLAFEPNPDNCTLLQLGVTANALGNVQLYPLAASDREQTLRLCPDGTNSTSVVLDAGPGHLPELSASYAVRAVVLDDLLADLPRLDVVKMDIDGGEYRALAGMTRLLKRHRPVLFLEYCPGLLETVSRVHPEAFLDRLEALDYDLHPLERVGEGAAGAVGKGRVLQSPTLREIGHVDLVAVPRPGR